MAIIIIGNQYGEEVREDIYEFDKDTDITDLLDYAIEGWAFRIPHEEDRKLWNKKIDEDWGKLDDSDYWQYNKPYVCDDKWYAEDGGYFHNLQTVINGAKITIKFLTMIKNIHGGQY